MIRAINVSCVLICLWCSSPVSAQTPSAAETKLREAGIEPTAESIQKYLTVHLAGETHKNVGRLIAELGDDDFNTRQRASRALAEFVPPPIGALTAASKSSDAEVAWRAKAILKTARPQADPVLAAALSLVASQRLAVGLPLLIQLHQQADSANGKADVLIAIFAILQEADRQTLDSLAKQADKPSQDLARALFARLDRKEIPADLTATFDAVKLKSGSSAGGGPNLVDGWEFQAKVDLTVIELGVFDRQPLGLMIAHEVAIWDLENRDAPLVQITVPAGEEAKLAGEFRMLPVEKTKLRAGRNYAVVAHYADPSDLNVGLANPGGLTIEYAPHIEVIGRRYAFPHKAMAYPNNRGAGADRATHGPTFRFEAVELK